MTKIANEGKKENYCNIKELGQSFVALQVLDKKPWNAGSCRFQLLFVLQSHQNISDSHQKVPSLIANTPTPKVITL